MRALEDDKDDGKIQTSSKEHRLGDNVGIGVLAEVH